MKHRYFIALTILAFATSGWSDFARGELYRDGEASWSVASNVEVEIEIISGRIELTGWDRDELSIVASGRGADSLVIEADHDRVSVRAKRRFFSWAPWLDKAGVADLKVSLPKGSRVFARTYNGPIIAREVGGHITLYSANGGIEVTGAPREANLETINSGISLAGRDTRVEARTINGSIDLSGVAEEVRASTMNGSIEVVGGLVHRIDLETLSGSIDLAVSLDLKASVRAKSMNGKLSFELPAATSARFEAKTFRGSIESDFTATSTSSRRHGPSNELRFDTGEASARVRMETFNGDVEIRQASN
jgi:DUF4097 and DUF4098 domain-containing protein YvlB